MDNQLPVYNEQNALGSSEGNAQRTTLPPAAPCPTWSDLAHARNLHKFAHAGDSSYCQA